MLVVGALALVYYRGRDDRKRKAAESRLTVSFENPTVSTLQRASPSDWEHIACMDSTPKANPSRTRCMKMVYVRACLGFGSEPDANLSIHSPVDEDADGGMYTELPTYNGEGKTGNHILIIDRINLEL